MNRHPSAKMLVSFLLVGIIGQALGAGTMGRQPAPGIKIWREFVSLLKSGKFTPDRIRPMPEMAGKADVLMGFLDQMKQQAHWQEWDRKPEILKNGALTNFIVPLTFGKSERTSYCFMFVEEGGQWYFQHLEAIFIRLDKTPPPPTSKFPDTNEAQKAWDREEDYWSKIIQWRGILAKEKGKDFFLGLLKDGGGYFVWAKSRVPFVPTHKAFILFLCWEQANLRGPNLYGEGVRLEKLTDEEAVVRLSPTYFILYQSAAHLKGQISFEDYKEIFETIWQDRALAAGWNLKIDYQDTKGYTECVFRFSRKPDKMGSD
ncbi:MAG: hypothetical protein LAP85_20420 [Acidobacteriia bacterium]|nr:hypothetical protein [Terriglobia bacterium]